MTKVTLIRHGATDWSIKGKHAGRTDLALTPRGIDQAKEARGKIAHIDFDRILCSPLQRATRTAQLLNVGAFTIDERMTERHYGRFEGLTTEEIREQQSGDWNVWTGDVPEGESLAAFQVRTGAVLNDALTSGVDRLLLIAHAHWIRLFTALWLRLPPESAALFRLDTGGLVELGWEREMPVLLKWNA